MSRPKGREFFVMKNNPYAPPRTETASKTDQKDKKDVITIIVSSFFMAMYTLFFDDTPFMTLICALGFFINLGFFAFSITRFIWRSTN